MPASLAAVTCALDNSLSNEIIPYLSQKMDISSSFRPIINVVL